VIFTELTDLAAARVGGRALLANDEFFASRHNLLKPGRGVFIPDRFTSRGKWMDGWETRRRRTPGHDWCIVMLGLRGTIRGVDIDTNHFSGNQPELGSIEACDLGGRPSRGRLLEAPWSQVLPPQPLLPSARNVFAVGDARTFTHVRLNIFPDGGVARLRVHGEVALDWRRLLGKRLDLAAIQNGGRVLAASDQHFGCRENLIMPGRAANMGDGWETRRRRGPGHDWAVLVLGHAGKLERVEVDTNHFKGNYPESCAIEGCLAPGAGLEELLARAWTPLLPRQRLRPHSRHFFARELAARGPFSHLRLLIYPDGGVSRLRVHGRPVLA
jgi:allantoicase